MERRSHLMAKTIYTLTTNQMTCIFFSQQNMAGKKKVQIIGALKTVMRYTLYTIRWKRS